MVSLSRCVFQSPTRNSVYNGICCFRTGKRRWVRSWCSPDLDSLLADLEAPEIADDVQAMQEKIGGVFKDGVAVSYGEDYDRRAAEAWQHGVVLVDRSHWGRLRLTGNDRLNFLHGQSTADINCLKPGQFCASVFVTPTGRTIDVATVLCQEAGTMLVTSPGIQEQLQQRLDKHIFPMDDVSVMDISSQTRMFTVLGPAANDVVAAWGSDEVTNLPEGSHAVMGFQQSPVIVFKSSGLGEGVEGWTVVVGEAAAGEFFRKVALQGAIPMGQDVWETARVYRGVPKPGAELTEEYNALETGLYAAISLDKGCYVGQETLAKVEGKAGVKQRLWRLRLREGSTCSTGDEVKSADGVKLGVVTSVATVGYTQFALAYLRGKVEGQPVDWEGQQVDAGGFLAKVEIPPALKHAF